MSQTERILYLDRQMRRNKKITVEKVAEHFEVSTRQIKRDIEYLRDRFNAPIIYDRQIKAYRYEDIFETLVFADQKLIMFYVAMKSLTESGHYIPVYSDEIIGKLSNDVPKDYKSICNKISYQLPRSDTINADFFIDICDSMREKKCLKITYINIKGETSERIIEIEQLINYDGSWYIVCFDEKRKNLRTFNIARIKKTNLTNISFQKHDENYEKELSQYLSDSFGIFKGKMKNIAIIHFYDTASEIIKTQNWHPNQLLKVFENYTELRLPIADYTEVLSRIIAFGSK